jgi:hypothetical protein
MCALHPVAVAVDRCATCEAPVCAPCSTYIELRAVCRACLDERARRRRRYLRALSLACAILYGFVGAEAWWCWDRGGPAPRPVVAADQSPCDDHTAGGWEVDHECHVYRDQLELVMAFSIIDRDWRAAGHAARRRYRFEAPVFSMDGIEALSRGELDQAVAALTVELRSAPNDRVAAAALMALYRGHHQDRVVDDIAAWRGTLSTCPMLEPCRPFPSVPPLSQ